ncbi:MAG: MFS transporter [Candidatus Thorarchaeota archaeon]
MKKMVTSDMERRSDGILEEGSPEEGPETREETDDRAPTLAESEKKDNLRESLRTIFSWRNYTVYLVTAWVFNGIDVMSHYFTLYLWHIGWEFIFIGAAMTAVAAFIALFRFVGGYIGDITNRKALAVVAMFFMATYYLVIGIFDEPIFILGALAIYSIFGLAQAGASAFIMDNIPKEHSGLALSLFRMGSSLGIITLLLFGTLILVLDFDVAFRLIYFVSGILLMLCTVGRAVLLETGRSNGRDKDESLWRDFLSENANAVKLILASMPGILAIVILDGLSDEMFRFGALIYTNDVLDIDYGGINVMLLTPLVISLPLLFRIGRMSDLRGMKRAILLVYSVMPICAALLIVAPTFSYWMPSSVVDAADALLPGLEVVFTTAFLALVMKYTNDILWALVLITMIQKYMPRTDTSKVLAVFWSSVYIIAAIGPFIGGLIFEFFSQSLLFAVVLVLNLFILGGVAYYGIERREPESLSEKMQSMELTIQKLKDEIEEFRSSRRLP